MPFEIERINIRPDGFALTFTKPVDHEVASRPEVYQLINYTHIYHKHYGSPEVDLGSPKVLGVSVSIDGLIVDLKLDRLVKGHVHEFDLPEMRSAEGRSLVHNRAYYTVNEIPAQPHPVPESPKWLTYKGGDGPGKGKHIILIAADQEYRSEQSLPMLAGILAKRHGFDCSLR